MKSLLFLAHRLPYPPNKGDKIRSYHLLRILAKHYRIHLVTFIDDENDWQYVDALKPLLASQHIEPIKPWQSKLQCLPALLTGAPLSFGWYNYSAVHQRVAELINSKEVDAVICYSSAMAQFAERYPELPRFMDFVDMDSEKWRQYAATGKAPMKWVHALEARRLADAERDIADSFDASWLVTPEERKLFCERLCLAPAQVGFYRNGVDDQYFAPDANLGSPYQPHEQALVFTGAMDYHANIDAVVWFVEQVWPTVRARNSNAVFYIVGSNPTAAVTALGKVAGVTVTGRVPDVRPYLQHAAVAVAPLRIARGIQNKVLEALCMGRTVVATPQALEGLVPDPLLTDLAHDSAAAFADACLQRMQAPLPIEACRDYIRAHSNWEACVQPVLTAIGKTLPERTNGSPS